jgi:hypothetical protein
MCGLDKQSDSDKPRQTNILTAWGFIPNLDPGRQKKNWQCLFLSWEAGGVK